MRDEREILVLSDVTYGFPQRPAFLGPISLTVRRGDCWGVVGPNGAGKSTLLRLMAGLHRPDAGSITLAGKALASWSQRDRARHIAYVPQTPRNDLADTARDVVLMGRFPHRTLGLFESPEDVRVVDRVMRETGTSSFADRPLGTLSGGEARRVHLAAALAQDTGLLLLDEPTSSLDLRNELETLGMIRRTTRDGSRAVVMVTHDVNLASRYCTHILLMGDGRGVAEGVVSEVMTPERIESVYGVRMVSLPLPETVGGAWMVPVETSERMPS